MSANRCFPAILFSKNRGFEVRPPGRFFNQPRSSPLVISCADIFQPDRLAHLAREQLRFLPRGFALYGFFNGSCLIHDLFLHRFSAGLRTAALDFQYLAEACAVGAL